MHWELGELGLPVGTGTTENEDTLTTCDLHTQNPLVFTDAL